MSKQTEHAARYGLTGNALKDAIMNDNKHDDGGPAFPTTGLTMEAYHSGIAGPGMSLRDWFAGQALAGCAAIEDQRTWKAGDPEVGEWRRRIALQDAEYCYRMADAMLKAREL